MEQFKANAQALPWGMLRDGTKRKTININPTQVPQSPVSVRQDAAGDNGRRSPINTGQVKLRSRRELEELADDRDGAGTSSDETVNSKTPLTPANDGGKPGHGNGVENPPTNGDGQVQNGVTFPMFCTDCKTMGDHTPACIARTTMPHLIMYDAMSICTDVSIYLPTNPPSTALVPNELHGEYKLFKSSQLIGFQRGRFWHIDAKGRPVWQRFPPEIEVAFGSFPFRGLIPGEVGEQQHQHREYKGDGIGKRSKRPSVPGEGSISDPVAPLLEQGIGNEKNLNSSGVQSRWQRRDSTIPWGEGANDEGDRYDQDLRWTPQIGSANRMAPERIPVSQPLPGNYVNEGGFGNPSGWPKRPTVDDLGEGCPKRQRFFTPERASTPVHRSQTGNSDGDGLMDLSKVDMNTPQGLVSVLEAAEEKRETARFSRTLAEIQMRAIPIWKGDSASFPNWRDAVVNARTPALSEAEYVKFIKTRLGPVPGQFVRALGSRADKVETLMLNLSRHFHELAQPGRAHVEWARIKQGERTISEYHAYIHELLEAMGVSVYTRNRLMLNQYCVGLSAFGLKRAALDSVSRYDVTLDQVMAFVAERQATIDMARMASHDTAVAARVEEAGSVESGSDEEGECCAGRHHQKGKGNGKGRVKSDGAHAAQQLSQAAARPRRPLDLSKFCELHMMPGHDNSTCDLRDKTNCFHCGNNDVKNMLKHLQSECSSKYCYNCYARGHIARSCRRPKRDRSLGRGKPHTRDVKVAGSTEQRAASAQTDAGAEEETVAVVEYDQLSAQNA